MATIEGVAVDYSDVAEILPGELYRQFAAGALELSERGAPLLQAHATGAVLAAAPAVQWSFDRDAIRFRATVSKKTAKAVRKGELSGASIGIDSAEYENTFAAGKVIQRGIAGRIREISLGPPSLIKFPKSIVRVVE